MKGWASRRSVGKSLTSMGAVAALLAFSFTGVSALGPGAAPAEAAPTQQWATSVTLSGTGVGATRTFDFGATGVTATETTTAVSGTCTMFATGATSFTGTNGNTFFSPAPTGPVGIAANNCMGPLSGGGDRVSTLSFSRPVISPVIHVQNLDASQLVISGTSTTGAPLTLTPLSRNNALEISGGTLNSTYGLAINNGCQANNGSNPTAGCGSIQISAESGTIESFTLRNTTTGSPLPAAGGNDTWGFTLSLPAALLPPVAAPFACDASGYLFQNPSPGVNLVQRVDLVTGEYQTIFETPTALNAVGYNTLDNFFYALQTGTTNLVRIGSDGSTENLGPVAGLPPEGSVVGDFDAAGQLWLMTGTQAYQIDLAPGSATYGDLVDTVTVTTPAGAAMHYDWGFTDGAFYSTGYSTVSGGNVLLRFDPATGAQSVVAPLITSDGTTLTALGAGAVYVDAAGYLYASDNATGNIYRIDTTTGATILLTNGPAAGGNDGARCASAPIPTMTVTKSVEGRQVPADQFTVGLVDPTGTVVADATTTGNATTVSTVNQPVSQSATYTITDTMAAGSASAINAYTTGIECLNTATGAPVPTTGTGPWSVTIPAAADFTCEVTNAAVPVGIELVKSADAAAQENIEVGQTITYSFAFKNTGDVPLTDIRIDESGFSGEGPLPVVTCPTTTVAAGQTVTCEATYEVTQADVDAGTISNEATAIGTPPTGFPPLEPELSNEVTVPNDPVPGISVVKSADAAAMKDIEVGQEVTYSFLVKNTGNVTLTDVTVIEGEFSGTGELSDVVCPQAAASLAPGAEVLCTASYTITQDDVDAGEVTNSATGTGTPPGDTPPPVSPPSEVTVPGAPTPAITVVKTADEAAQEEIVLGQEVTYSFMVTNTGNVTLTDVGVIEGEFSGTGELSDVVCPEGAASLAPGASVICTAGYTITQADVDAGEITNSATGTGTPPGGTPPPVSPPSEVTIPGAPAPGLAVVKTASAEGVTAAGQDIAYSFVLTNTGNITLSDVTVAEGEFTGTGELSDVVCPAGARSLAPGAQVTCTATYTTTQADVDAGAITNTATGIGTPPGSEDPIESDPSTSTVEFPAEPGITVVKSADAAAQEAIELGQEITYSFLVKNTGNLTLENVTVDEGEFTGAGELSEVSCPEGAASLAPGAEIICTATYTVLQADVDAGTITNTATATGTPARGEARVSPESEARVPSVTTPGLSVVKTASSDTVTGADQDITYSFLLTNTGNVTLTDVTAVEGEFTGTGELSTVTCPEEAGSLAPGASVTCTASYTTTEADLEAGAISNTATGSATIPGGGNLVSDPSTAEVTVEAPTGTPEDPETPQVQQPVPPKKGGLADTGLTAGPFALGGLVILLLGASVVAASKLRRREEV